MGAYSHEELQQARADAVRPPVPSRRCTGRKWWPELVDWRTGAVTREAQWVECNVGAVAFVPEVAYCANHIPPELMDVANRRLVLWNALASDLWLDVCADLPVPSS